MPRRIHATIKKHPIEHPQSSKLKHSKNHHHRRHRSNEEKHHQSSKERKSLNKIHTNIRSRSIGRLSETKHDKYNSQSTLSVTSNRNQQNLSKQELLQNLSKTNTSFDNRKYNNSALQNKSINDVLNKQPNELVSQGRDNYRTVSETSTHSLNKIDTNQHEILDDAWSDRSISNIYRDQEKQKESKYRRRKYCCGCPWPCILLSLLSSLCLGITIAAILVALLTTNKTNTTTTTETTTSATTSTTTTTSTTSTTSVTSSTTSTTSTTSSTSSTTSTTSETTSTTTSSSSSSTSTTSETTSTTTETTSTSATTLTTDTTTTSTATTTTSTTSTSTTTTTLPTCNSACGNDTTILSVSLFARWNFENVFDDLMLTYNGTSTNGPTFVLGYIGQALSLNSASNQYLSTSFIPINSKSFTVDAWIYPTSFPNTKGIHTIAGLCPQQTAQQCFQFGLHSNVTSTTSTGYFGLWEAADLRGSMSIPVNQWTHVAIVYSKSKTKQVIYVNGNLDNSRGTSNGFNGTSGTFYIGNNYDLTSNPSYGTNNFQGYIDQLTISNGVRSTCEVLNVATMACRLSFDDSTNFLADSGPNSVSINAYNYISVSGLKGTQAISFTTSSSSYLQATGFRFLSYNNAPFSISLWIQPILLQGTIVGSSLGYDPLTFASNGSLIARVATVSVSYNILLELTPIWSHIVLTWSSSGGLNLYINNILVKSALPSTSTGSGASTNNLILGGGSFSGTIDEWRLYSRELPSSDICAIFTN